MTLSWPSSPAIGPCTLVLSGCTLCARSVKVHARLPRSFQALIEVSARGSRGGRGIYTRSYARRRRGAPSVPGSSGASLHESS